ncbi:MAG: hypothetical protein K9N11_09485 [Lentisphaeria bacterium]|nr:hypothetical protein [Lentisphaeria bacterium]
MNGKKLIRIVQEQYPEIPIIAMTGYVDSVLDETLLSIGARAVFKKPYSTYQLSRTIRELLTPE